MEQYTIYCTKEQAKKALELGTPLIQVPSLTIIPDGSENLKAYKYEDNLYLYPTAEQMIGFILESGKGYSADLSELIREQGYKQGCLTFIDNCLK